MFSEISPKFTGVKQNDLPPKENPKQIQSSVLDITSAEAALVQQSTGPCGAPGKSPQQMPGCQVSQHLQATESTAPVQTQPLAGDCKRVLHGPPVVHASAESLAVLELECHVPVQKDIKIKNADSWKSLGKPVKASSVLKSSDELFNQFRKAAIEKEVKARTQEQIRKHLEHSAKDPKVSQESQREFGSGFTPESSSSKVQGRSHGEEQSEQPQLPSPSEAQDMSKRWLLRDRNLAREKEQERRRREAMAGTIDMTLQSDIMTMFENNFD